jgi:hypothetical protein
VVALPTVHHADVSDLAELAADRSQWAIARLLRAARAQLGLEVAGRLPNVMRDVRSHPIAGGMAITAPTAVGAYVSVPIHRPDGTSSRG